MARPCCTIQASSRSASPTVKSGFIQQLSNTTLLYCDDVPLGALSGTRLVQLLLLLILSCLVITTTPACINDREIERADDDYRRDYPQPSTPEAQPITPVVPFAIAGVGALGLVLIGSGLLLQRKRLK